MQTPAELDAFLQQWTSDPNGCREVFVQFQSRIQAHSDITIDFVARPGLTYSLRATRTGQDRPLFVLMDVIDENPRWLSVCFYGDMITDPDEYGDLVPEGLMGEDGYCFDLDTNNPDLAEYIGKRLDEAYENAAG